MSGPALRIEIDRRALRELGALDRAAAERLRSRIEALAADPWPSGARTLRHPSLRQPAYRIRVGDYRVIYAVDEDAAAVRVLGVGHRRDVYRRLCGRQRWP